MFNGILKLQTAENRASFFKEFSALKYTMKKVIQIASLRLASNFFWPINDAIRIPSVPVFKYYFKDRH